jgi:hypothetical protein
MAFTPRFQTNDANVVKIHLETWFTGGFGKGTCDITIQAFSGQLAVFILYNIPRKKRIIGT